MCTFYARYIQCIHSLFIVWEKEEYTLHFIQFER